MEAFSLQFCRSIRSYWRSRKYQRLRGSAVAGNNTGRVARFGSTNRRFKLRAVSKIRIRAFPPLRSLAYIREAYVTVMLGVAGKNPSLVASNVGPQSPSSRRSPKTQSIRPKLGDFERRLVLEIYKSVMSSEEFVGRS